MRTDQFPAVVEARKIVLRQLSFYNSMMTDAAPKKSTVVEKRHSVSPVAARKRSSRRMTSDV